MSNKLLRRVLAAGGVLSLLAVGLPQVAMAAAPERSATVVLTDSGFDKHEYTIGYSGGTAVDNGELTFVNKGNVVHAVRSVPGTLDQGVAFGRRVDALGNDRPCWQPLPCGKYGALDTGGIDPGGSVTLGFRPYNAPVDYTITSATDCLYGNSTGFDCTPVTVHVVSIPARSAISGTLWGSVLRTAGNTDCLADKLPIVPDIGAAYCFSAVRDTGELKGSPRAALGDTTVEITDLGFNPTLVYVKAGSTVTWVNHGSRVHSVQKKGPQAPPDGYHNLTSPGLAPGETYTYTFPAGASTNYQSNVQSDLVLPANAGNAGGFAPPTAGRGKYGGEPAMIGRVAVVG